jgi:hypothetical protein
VSAFSKHFSGLESAILGDVYEEPAWEGPLPELSAAAWSSVKSGRFPSGRGSVAVFAELHKAELLANVRHGMSRRREWTERAKLLRERVTT